MRSASAKPFVITSKVRSPFRSSSALVATAKPKVSLVLADSVGSCEVEVRQKTFHRVKMDFERNDADDQDKVFSFTVLSVDVSGSTCRTSLDWSGSTAKSSTAGGSLAVGVNGQGLSGQASGSWSQAVNQGVDNIVIVAEADYDRKRTVTLGPGLPSHTFAISVTMDPSASIKDNNSVGLPDSAHLKGYGDYGTVICLGKITLIANNDGTRTNTVKFNGAEPGDPRNIDDVAPDHPQNLPVIPKPTKP